MDIPAFCLAAPSGWHLAAVPYTTTGLLAQEATAGSFLFLVRDGLTVEAALDAALAAAAIDDLLIEQATEEGYDFNLADIINRWPDADWAHHGLVPVSLPVTDLSAVVDHDETLVEAA